MTTTESETVKGEVVPARTAIEELGAYIAGLEPEDEAEVQERILRNILNASTPEALANAGSSIPADDLLNVELKAHDIHPAESGFADGMGFYLHVDVETVANGDRLSMSVGAQDVVVKLVQAKRKGWMPFAFTMARSEKPTTKGYYPIFMRSSEPPF